MLIINQTQSGLEKNTNTFTIHTHTILYESKKLHVIKTLGQRKIVKYFMKIQNMYVERMKFCT